MMALVSCLISPPSARISRGSEQSLSSSSINSDGKLSDLFGRKPIFIFGLIIFLIGSALSGASQSMIELIAFRAFQGLGAAALLPIAIAVVGDLFTPRERGKWQGVTGAVFGISSIIGPAVGGWLTQYASWCRVSITSSS